MHLNHLNALDSGKLSFIYSHYGKQYYFTEYDENLNSFSRPTRINLRHPFQNLYILGSCNRLICFNACYDNIYQPAYICNPITREFILFPKVEGKQFLTGFGYIPSTNEYKVVSICSSKRDPNFGIIQTYTIGSGIGWRNVGKMDYDLISTRQNNAVFLNGSIYWVIQGTIFSLDLADEEVRIIPSPPQAGNPPSTVRMRVLGDFLCACYTNDHGWDLWFFKKNINNHDVIWNKEFSDHHIDVRPITFTKSGGLLCYDYRDNRVFRYAPKASSPRMLVNFGENFQFGEPHRNTLVSLKALGEDKTKLMASDERARSGGETESRAS
ncbi:F-box/kelch-repeat protein At3g23880-like [Papaver somniferum]|uniref:F-box/kelch-repeat protein At3g23880-like n=1 Tax=Papaver somniferum TaxID=3469 RepID=UPI000E6FC6BB|nr:F-box/kelch-repeat protein At3g23880-like [Papaver somniferum]